MKILLIGLTNYNLIISFLSLFTAFILISLSPAVIFLIIRIPIRLYSTMRWYTSLLIHKMILINNLILLWVLLAIYHASIQILLDRILLIANHLCDIWVINRTHLRGSSLVKSHKTLLTMLLLLMGAVVLLEWFTPFMK